MEKEVKMATLVDEEGSEYELEVVKEFDYKDKKYAVLYDDACDCDDEDESEEETDDESEEEEEEETCECDEKCDDDCECHCHDEDDCGGHIYVLEVVKGEDGKDSYGEVDESLMEELIPIVEKELYPTEE